MDGHQTVSSVGRKGWNEGTAGSEARAHGWGGGDVLRMIFSSFGSACIAGVVKVAWVGLHG